MASPPPETLFHTGSPSHCAAAGAARPVTTTSVNMARFISGLAAHPPAVTLTAREQRRHHPAAHRRAPRPGARARASSLRHHAEPERLAPGTVEDQVPSQNREDEDAPEGDVAQPIHRLERAEIVRLDVR